MHCFQHIGVGVGQNHFEDVGSLILRKHLDQFLNIQLNCLVRFHCNARIFKLNITHIANILRPLEMTKEVRNVGKKNFLRYLNSFISRHSVAFFNFMHYNIFVQ